MSKVYAGASTSLDGYIAGLAGTGFEHVFEWYGKLQVEVPTTHPEMTLRMTRSAPSMATPDWPSIASPQLGW